MDENSVYIPNCKKVEEKLSEMTNHKLRLRDNFSSALVCLYVQAVT